MGIIAGHATGFGVWMREDDGEKNSSFRGSRGWEATTTFSWKTGATEARVPGAEAEATTLRRGRSVPPCSSARALSGVPSCRARHSKPFTR